MEKIKLSVVGLGCRGRSLIYDVLLGLDDVVITGICDVYQDRIEETKELLKGSGITEVVSSTDYRDVIIPSVADAVLVSTSWEAHIDVACDAMKNKLFVGMEVGGAYSLDDCFRLVRTQEITGSGFMFLENCCYGRYELMVMNMVRQGLFGDIIHCEGGYRHDLRTEVLFGEENRHYRLRNYMQRNCDNYPTHELGPIAQILDINGKNRMISLTSTSSKASGLNDYARLNSEVNQNYADYKFSQGDVVVTNIKCAGGELITLTLDTTLPRPYSRGFMVQGTRGMYSEEGNYIYLDTDFGPESHWNWKPNWNNADKYLEKYEHPIWQAFLSDGLRGGHGGMDYLVFRAFFDFVHGKTPSPIDVYDAASWMCITPLSEISIKNSGAPVEIPDFKNK